MVLLAPLKTIENNNFQKHPKISSFLLDSTTYKLLRLSKRLFHSCYHFSHQNVSFTGSRWLYLKQKASQVVPLLKCGKLPKTLWCLQRMNSLRMTRLLPHSSLMLFSFSQWHHIPKCAHAKSHAVLTLHRLFHQYILSSMSTLLQHREL